MSYVFNVCSPGTWVRLLVVNLSRYLLRLSVVRTKNPNQCAPIICKYNLIGKYFLTITALPYHSLYSGLYLQPALCSCNPDSMLVLLKRVFICVSPFYLKNLLHVWRQNKK